MNETKQKQYFWFPYLYDIMKIFYLNTGRIGVDNPQCAVVQPERSYCLRKSRKSHART